MTNLLPKGLPIGKELLEEGKRIADKIQIGKNGFDTHREQSFFDWYLTELINGNVIFFPQLGLKTVDDQEEGLKKLYKGFQDAGIDLGIVLITASLLNGVPPSTRKKAPAGTSYVYSGMEDYKRIAMAAPVFAAFGDYAVGCPNSVENVVNALTSGCIGVGTLSQFSWRFPYWDDEVGQIAETIKSMGIIAAKRDDMVSLSSYLGDGIPGSFIDHASMVGYALIEQYISETLCGASYTIGLGGLMSNIVDKCATWLAINEAGKIDEFSPVIGHFEGNTIEVTENMAANYGLVVSEFIVYALLERKYKTGAMFLPKPVTEAIRVPTVDEIVDVASACKSSMNRVIEIEAANLFDDSQILKLKDKLVLNGKKFYDNVMNGFLDLGVDIKDPLQMLLALKTLGAEKLETMFHAGEKDPSRYRGFVPIALTAKQKRYEELVEESLVKLKDKNLMEVVKGKTIVLGSGDTHQFALFIISEVLNKVGAKIVNAGVDLDPDQLLELAAQENASHIAVSLHNGQCMDWVKTFMEHREESPHKASLYVGGTLNTIVESCSEPVDARQMLIQIGAIPCADVVEMIKIISRQLQ